MINIREIKRRAREQLGNGLFEEKWLMALVAYLLFSAILSAMATTGIGLVFSGCLIFGFMGIFTFIARGKEEIDIAQLFDGFKGEAFSKSLVLFILSFLYTFLWALFFVIPGIIAAYSYSMAFYVMNDHPEFTASQCINESRRLMDGHKMDLFCLQLSFFGWAIVCALTFGIGSLWLAPYMQTAHANFYEDIKKEKGR